MPIGYRRLVGHEREKNRLSKKIPVLNIESKHLPVSVNKREQIGYVYEIFRYETRIVLQEFTIRTEQSGLTIILH